jgi:hypothetical protein
MHPTAHEDDEVVSAYNKEKSAFSTKEHISKFSEYFQKILVK